MSALASTSIADDIATVTMRRPEARNALSLELIQALGDAIGEVERGCADSGGGNVRVMILTGEGLVFCAGMDLRGVISDPRKMADMLLKLAQVTMRIRRLPIPTIARVQGAAVGGGCGLMVVTDFAITHPESKVGYPEVSLGVCPAVVAPWLIKKIGAGRARAMLLGGGTISGHEGYEIGLATHLVALDKLDALTLELAKRLATGGPVAIATTKRWLNELDGSMEDAVFEKAAKLSAEVIAGAEAQARLRKIFEK